MRGCHVVWVLRVMQPLWDVRRIFNENVFSTHPRSISAVNSWERVIFITSVIFMHFCFFHQVVQSAISLMVN